MKYIKKPVKYTVLLITLFTVCLISYLISCPNKSRRILVVQTFDSLHPSYVRLNNMIVSNFKRHGINPDIRTIYLNTENLIAKEELMEARRYTKEVTRNGWIPEVIISNNDQATYDILKCGDPLYHKVPVVFAGVRYPNWKLLKKCPNVTGFEDNKCFMENLKFIKAVMKRNISIYTSVDTSFLDKKTRADIISQLSQEKVYGMFTTPKMTIKDAILLCKSKGYTLLDEFQMHTYQKGMNGKNDWVWPQYRVYNPQVSGNSESAEWPLNGPYNDAAYLQVKGDNISTYLIAISAIPSFTVINDNFNTDENSKLIGGYFTTLEVQAEEEVEYAARILKGEKVKNLPIVKSKKEYVVDRNALKMNKIKEQDIPSYCKIINQPFSKQYPVLWGFLLGSMAIAFLILVALYIRAIRQKRKMHRASSRERHLLKLVIQGAKAFVWTYQEDHFTFNDSYWKLKGTIPHPTSTDMIIEDIHPNQQKRFLEMLKQNKKKESGIYQLQARLKGEDYQWWEVRYVTTKDEKGKSCVSGLSMNIEEIKERETELEKLRDRAEKVEMKQSFIDNISHEIRTPLNSIIGFTNLLVTSGNLSDDEKEAYMKIIMRNNKSLLKIIDFILLYSAIVSDDVTFRRQNKTIKQLIDESMVPLKDITNTSIKVCISCSEPSPVIYTDNTYFVKVLTHLVENALKFTHKGSICVGYELMKDEEKIAIYVEDTGVGIHNEDLPLIFNQFYKCDRFIEGTGLGLALCKLIVEKLGGEIIVKSQLGKGSKFSILMPHPSLNN